MRPYPWAHQPTRAAAWLQQEHRPPDTLDPWVVAERIRRLHESEADVAPRTPDPGSELAADDSTLDPYQLSHAVEFAIGIALDHLEALRGQLIEAKRTYPWAQHTLLRAALENACTAVWLIGPDNPSERRYRRLRLQMHDADEAGRARELHGQSIPSGRSTGDIKNKIRHLAPDGRSVDGLWSYRKVVRAAAEHMHTDPDILELLWRVQSGLAHGRTWATLAMLERTEEASATPGVVNMRLTTSVEQLMPATSTALNLVRTAIRLRDRRSRTPKPPAIAALRGSW